MEIIITILIIAFIGHLIENHKTKSESFPEEIERGRKELKSIVRARDEEFIEELKKINPDVIVVVAYGQILPESILNIPKYGCINVHASLLPKYRGAAPIQWSVINGDKETGVTIMQMDEGLDTGDILLVKKTNIDVDETFRLRAYRVWEIINSDAGNIMIEPDFNYEILSGNYLD